MFEHMCPYLAGDLDVPCSSWIDVILKFVVVGVIEEHCPNMPMQQHKKAQQDPPEAKGHSLGTRLVSTVPNRILTLQVQRMRMR